MLFTACAVALLCLASVSRAAPPACVASVRVDPHRLVGRWALVAESMRPLSLLAHFKDRDSTSVNFSSNTSDTAISYTSSVRFGATCEHLSFNISLAGDHFTYDVPRGSNLTPCFTRISCRDCMLILSDVESEERRHLYLLSRRRELEEEEMDDFRLRVLLMNMPPPVVMDPTKELCP